MVTAVSISSKLWTRYQLLNRVWKHIFSNKLFVCKYAIWHILSGLLYVYTLLLMIVWYLPYIILIPWLSFFWPILDHLSQLISASTSLYHFCTYHNPVTFLFPALSRIPSANSTSSILPQTHYRHISALTPPPFPFLFLPSAIIII
jgi:hypothetical protein